MSYTDTYTELFPKTTTPKTEDFSLEEMNSQIVYIPPRDFFDTCEEYYESCDAFNSRKNARNDNYLKNTKKKLNAIKNFLTDCKFDSKKFFKNKKIALKFLDEYDDNIRCSVYTYNNKSNNLLEDFSNLYPQRNHTCMSRLNKSCKVKDLYEFIDKITPFIIIDRINDVFINKYKYDLYLQKKNLFHIINRKFWFGNDFIVYYIGVHIKKMVRIKKIFSTFLQRLYNPHTELGRNFALKNIEWAYE